MSYLRRLTLLAVALPLLLSVGCTATGRRVQSPFSPPQERGQEDDTQRLRVINLGFNDATIFARVAGRRIRVGIVNGAQEKDFEFDLQGGANSVRFEYDFFAGPTCFTEELRVNRGGVIQLNLPATPQNAIGCRLDPS